MQKIKVILVDDHQVVIDGIKAGFLFYNDIEVIGEANGGAELYDLLEKLSPDIVLLDISMPKISGIDVCKKIKQDYPAIKIIIFTGDETEDALFKTLSAGANGFLPKETSRDELAKAIYQVNNGTNYISNKIPNTVLIYYINKTNPDKTKVVKTILTVRELEIIKLIADGFQYKKLQNNYLSVPKQ